MDHCRKCGIPIQPTAKMCPACGSPVGDLVASASPTMNMETGAMSGEAELAERGTRLLAQILNILLFLPVVGIILFFVSMDGGEGGLSTVGIGFGVLLILGLFAVQIYLLTTKGQDIGKVAMGIKIVKTDTGENGGFVPNVLLRGFVNGLLGNIPFYVIVDLLFIFRNDRRCIHDLLASTKVVKV